MKLIILFILVAMAAMMGLSASSSLNSLLALLFSDLVFCSGLFVFFSGERYEI